MAKPRSRKKNGTVEIEAKVYRHPTADSPLRPDVGTQPQFRKTKPPVKYRYDSSVSPALEWDAQNSAREFGEWLLSLIDESSRLPAPHLFDQPRVFKRPDSTVASVRSLQEAVEQLKRLGGPFLNWAGKAERLSFDVPTLPLFVHERLSTKAIIETLKGHKKVQTEQLMFDLFADPQHSIADQVLKAYEYRDKWVNRLILGDSLVVMNSLLHYEGLGSQVQMIYMDPPYGIKFGSNFQPFVRKRDVGHNDDDDMTREPEMVQAYRDTWELGLHSYLSYLRDRLLLARDLLTPSGSIFVQISDENLHHVRELMDEVFGSNNFISIIAFTKAAGGLESSDRVGSRLDYLVWYSKNSEQIKYRPLYEKRLDPIDSGFTMIELSNGERRTLTAEEKKKQEPIPTGSRLFASILMTKPGPGTKFEIEFNGKKYNSGKRWWGTTKEGLEKVIQEKRVLATEKSIRFLRYFDDFQFKSLSNLWDGLGGAADPIYVVQTSSEVIRRCVLMTTDPGDLVVDPTCGSGTTAYVCEQWGRRWITVDTSRVPLALARQRLLTATYPYYKLRDETSGPIAGFVYERKQNSKGEQIGGIVPHVTLKSIANNEPPAEEILVDRPEEIKNITRVTGPFCLEATIPTPLSFDDDSTDRNKFESQEDYGSYVSRMLEVLRKSPILQLGGGKKVQIKNVRLPAKTLSLSAEAVVMNGQEKPVALVFGPENGAVSEKL
ncbi:MAG: site-specific DNA-methyltransferase, partial [Deltaproteobacteria bacterium]|nr:site-specific DNA-methyltransferase [Deltaproteobacteria bacterium]